MISSAAYKEVLNCVSDLISAKYKLQNTFIFKGFGGNINNYPRVSFQSNLSCGLTYLYHWMPIEEAIKRMEENGYIDINDFE